MPTSRSARPPKTLNNMCVLTPTVGVAEPEATLVVGDKMLVGVGDVAMPPMGLLVGAAEVGVTATDGVVGVVPVGSAAAAGASTVMEAEFCEANTFVPSPIPVTRVCGVKLTVAEPGALAINFKVARPPCP